MTRVEVIVPVRNEEVSIPSFLSAVESARISPAIQLSVLFIEDGSTDGTVALLRRLSREKPHVRYFSMANGFGEGPAIMFGVRQSKADAIIMMAAEGHPPNLIPHMIRGYEEGAKVVQCIRDSFHGRRWYRDLATAIFVPTIQLLTGFNYPEQNVYYRLLSRDYAEKLLESPHYWRFVRFPLPREETGELRKIHVKMEQRESEESQYTLARLLRLGLDGVLTWTNAPRLAALNILLLFSAAALAWSGAPVLAPLPLLAGAFLSYRYYWLRTANHVKNFIIRERSTDAREATRRIERV